MHWYETLSDYIVDFGIYRGTINAYDIIEILILTFLVYYILVWMKTTRAWQLLKGLIVIGLFLSLAYFFNMTTIIWLARNVLSFAAVAIIVVMQPELRHALEELGQKNFLPNLLTESSKKEKESIPERTVNEIVNACYEMGRAKTGALIVIEQNESLKEYEKTGIAIDGLVTSQLLINIFEHNTPLHDGAVIIRGDRVVAATCYLPLTANLSLSKELGTRHRAAVGVSEETDSLTIIVSEETGMVSAAYEGKLTRDMEPKALHKKITHTMNRQREEVVTEKKSIWKGLVKAKNEKQNSK